jgi:hypothetical protein
MIRTRSAIDGGRPSGAAIELLSRVRATLWCHQLDV